MIIAEKSAGQDYARISDILQSHVIVQSSSHNAVKKNHKIYVALPTAFN